MIFATVGTQLPFDRLITSLEKWSLKQNVSGCFAQVGPEGKVPQHIESAATLTPLQFAKQVADCKVIVSHAGMGTILTALQHCRPIIVMPRLVKFGEHRNDHQLATVSNLEDREGIHVARSEDELFEKLDAIASLETGDGASVSAEPQLLSAIGHFIMSNGASGDTHA
ncbi:glycosyltransferase [Kordiimonas aquimaris]|uniref:glycosyltransferase n=1 Tax=Kordiimonas aquimaris TaxID=707591 RepID=UPI0021D221E4|nr:glycosyltransferase [Kordiimonas aquimaris]